jgi:hypothetical protein
MVPRRHRVRTRAARGVSGGDCAQFISPLLRGASIVEIDHTGIIVRHIEPLPGPDLHRLIAPALPGAFAHSITSSAREQRKRKGDSVNSLFIFLRLNLTWSRTRLNHIGSSRSGKAFGESKGGRGDPTFDAPTS